MNKILLSIFTVLITAVSVQAQTQKGNQLLGGTISLLIGKGTNTNSIGGTVTENGTNKLSTFGIGPNYSFFIADKLDLGVAAFFAKNKTTTIFPSVGSDLIEQKHYNYSVFLRKYFLWDNKIGVRAGPFVSYQYGRTNYEYHAAINEEMTNKEFDGGIGIDFVYFPTRRFGLAATLGSLAYNSSVQTTAELTAQDYGEVKDHSFGLNLATSGLTLSLHYVFGK